MEEHEISFEEMQEIYKYSQSLQSGTIRLAKVAAESEKSINEKNSFAKEIRSDFNVEMQKIKLEVSSLSDSVKDIQKAMTILVGNMKSAVKKDELARLEKRIDVWSPHLLVNREEAKRIIFSKQ